MIEHAVMKNNKKMAAGGERGSAVSTGDPCLGRGGAYVLFFCCHSLSTFDHAHLSGRSAVPTLDRRHLKHLGTHYRTFFPYIT